MTEEDSWDQDSWDQDSSSEEDDTFSHANRNEPYVSHRKANVSTGDSIDSLGDQCAPRPLPRYVCSCKVDRRARSPQRMKHHTRQMCFTHKQEYPCYARTASDTSVDEVLTLLPMRQRKTSHKLRREEEAAITLQSAWRGCQVRRDIDKMNKAATQIKAAFRGYMTRKELRLGFHGYGRTDQRMLKKKMRDENKSKSFPGPLNYLQKLVVASEAHPESQSIFLTSEKPRNYPKNIIEDYPLLNPNVTFFEIESALRPNTEMFTYTSFNVFATGIKNRRYQDAATTIQAAWRGHQIRQKASPGKRPRKSFCSKFAIKKTSWKHALSGQTLEEHEIHQIFAAKSDLHEGRKGTISFKNVPRIRNINIYAVVKGMPDSSPKPNISIRVLSPNAVVQGYERDMSRGVQALYTVKNNSASRPSQILIHVNMQKGKDVRLKSEKKKQNS